MAKVVKPAFEADPERLKEVRRKSRRAQVERNELAQNPLLQDELNYCLQMAADGWPWDKIASQSKENLGYAITAYRAKKLVRAEMGRTTPEEMQAKRNMEELRLNRYLTRLAPAIQAGELDALKEARQISESRRKMWGLDMPANVRVTGDVQHHLDPAVQKLFEEQKERQAQRESNDRLAIAAVRTDVDTQAINDSDPDFRTEPYEEPLDAEFEDEESEIEDLTL